MIDKGAAPKLPLLPLRSDPLGGKLEPIPKPFAVVIHQDSDVLPSVAGINPYHLGVFCVLRVL
jgi:hypothetical protein